MVYENNIWRLSLNDAQASVCGLSQIQGTSVSVFFGRRLLNDISSLNQDLKTKLMKTEDCFVTETQFRMLRNILMVLEAKLVNPGLDKDYETIIRSIFDLLDVTINKT